MSRKLLILFVLAVFLSFTEFQVKPAVSAPKNCDDEEVRQIIRDVQSLNLINSLYLSQDQINELLPIVREVDQMQRELKQLSQSKNNEIMDVLQEMRSQLKTNIDLSEDLKRRFHRIEEPILKKRAENKQRMEELVDKVYNDVLNENQRIMLTEYHPCLVPQRSVTNPERIGQSGGNERISRLMDRIRRVPDSRYPMVKQRVLDRVREALELRIPDESERSRTLIELEKAMDKVRSLSEEEYQLEKDTIIADIKPQHNSNKDDQKHVITRYYLLNPGIISVLEEKQRVAGY